MTKLATISTFPLFLPICLKFMKSCRTASKYFKRSNKIYMHIILVIQYMA